jgi:hypothetical protein
MASFRRDGVKKAVIKTDTRKRDKDKAEQIFKAATDNGYSFLARVAEWIYNKLDRSES